MSFRKTLVLEYDDFHWKEPENCMETILQFVARFPQIRISFFTPSAHSNLPLRWDSQWCHDVRRLIESGNIRLAVHGLLHTSEEFKLKTPGDAYLSIRLAENHFMDAALPFTRVFRAPHWGINEGTYQALAACGYTHLYTHENYSNLLEISSPKSVIYNWNLNSDAPDVPCLIGHGHTHDVCGNGIRETFHRVARFIEDNDPIFKFVDEI